jgi:hypothetical protein
MKESDIKRRVQGERLRLAANMCQTLAIGIVLIAILTPLLASRGGGDEPPWPYMAVSAVATLFLFVYAHVLIGVAVRREA